MAPQGKIRKSTFVFLMLQDRPDMRSGMDIFSKIFKTNSPSQTQQRLSSCVPKPCLEANTIPHVPTANVRKSP